MSDVAQQMAQAAPTRAPAARPAAPEPVRDEFTDLSDLQDRLGNRATTALIASALAGAGQPLDPSLRAEMERRFGHGFAGVRVHMGDVAAKSARAVQALAYTVGHDIVLGAGQDPDSASGRRVMMHELAHVTEHDTAPPRPGSALVVGDLHDPAEHRADRIADAAQQMAGRGADATGARAGGFATSAVGATNGTLVRRQLAPGLKAADPEPVIPGPPEPRIVQVVTAWLVTFGIGAGRAGVIVISGSKMRLYRNGQPHKTIRRTSDAFPLPPGVYRPGQAAPAGGRQVLRLYKGDHDQWQAMQGSVTDPFNQHHDRHPGARGQGGLHRLPEFRR